MINLAYLIAQLPPTPTPIPMGAGSNTRAAQAIQSAQQLDLSSIPKLWDLAPEVVGLWNMFGEYTPVLMWVVFAVLIVIVFFFIYRLIARISESDDV